MFCLTVDVLVKLLHLTGGASIKIPRSGRIPELWIATFSRLKTRSMTLLCDAQHERLGVDHHCGRQRDGQNYDINSARLTTRAKNCSLELLQSSSRLF